MSKTTKELNELATKIHKIHEKWWQDPTTGQPIQRSKSRCIMLVITELAECCEGERKNLMDDKLPHRKMAEVEMADAMIRLLDYAIGFEYPIKSNYFYPRGEEEAEWLLMLCDTAILVYTSNSKSLAGNYISSMIKSIEMYCIRYGYDLWGAIEEKLAYNQTREDHKHEARLQAGGKKW